MFPGYSIDAGQGQKSFFFRSCDPFPKIWTLTTISDAENLATPETKINKYES